MKFVTLECCSCSDFQVLFKFFCQAWNLSAVAVLSFKFYSSFFVRRGTWVLWLFCLSSSHEVFLSGVELECCSCFDFQVPLKFFCQAWNLSAVAVLTFKFYSSFFVLRGTWVLWLFCLSSSIEVFLSGVELECCSCSGFQVPLKFFSQTLNLSALAVLTFKFHWTTTTPKHLEIQNCFSTSVLMRPEDLKFRRRSRTAVELQF